jgi:hypothetical protein
MTECHSGFLSTFTSYSQKIGTSNGTIVVEEPAKAIQFLFSKIAPCKIDAQKNATARTQNQEGLG